MTLENTNRFFTMTVVEAIQDVLGTGAGEKASEFYPESNSHSDFKNLPA